MNCERVKNLLSDYIYDNLKISQKLEIKEHLKNCQECQKELDEFEKVGTLLDHLQLKEAPVEMWDNIYDEIKNEKRVNIWGSIFGYKPLLPALAVLIPVFIVVISWGSFFNKPVNIAEKEIQDNYVETHLAISMTSPLNDRVGLGAAIILNEDEEFESE